MEAVAVYGLFSAYVVAAGRAEGHCSGFTAPIDLAHSISETN